MPDLPDLTPEMLTSYAGRRELEGAQALRSAQYAPTPVHGLEEIITDPPYSASEDDTGISFDQPDFDHEIAESRFSTPAVGNRFNVMRPSAVRPAPPPAVRSPQAGAMREVGRVGRFAILTEQEPSYEIGQSSQSEQAREVRRVTGNLTVAERGAERRATAVELNARQREYRAVIHEALPTAYDRLMGEDLFEDDLE
jgi:hypothetical protein